MSGFKVLLPAFVPSWRFFDAVTASPRVDFRLLGPQDGLGEEEWAPFRPRPAALSFGAMIRRLLWNPQWNEDLYLVSLAERMLAPGAPAAGFAHSQRELLVRVARHLADQQPEWQERHLQVRIRLVDRAGEDGAVAYLSAPCPMDLLVGR